MRFLSSCLVLFLLSAVMGYGLVAAELVVGPNDRPADILKDPQRAAANAHALAGSTAASGHAGWDWTAIAGGVVAGVSVVAGLLGGPYAKPVLLTLAAVSPWLKEHFAQGDAALAKVDAGAAVIASTEQGRYLLQRLDTELGRDERAQSSVTSLIKTITGGKASTIEGLFVNGLQAAQVDAGQQGAISAWRQQILDTVPTVDGKIGFGAAGITAINVTSLEPAKA